MVQACRRNAADNSFEGVQTRSGLAGSSLKPDTEYYAYKGMEIVSTVSVVPSAFQTPQVNRAASRYYGSDLVGSVSLTADYSGNIVSEYDYDAFGHRIDGKVEGSLNFGYNGKPTDSATGLINFGYRDYAPNLGRFTTVDPIRDGSDWYAYCHYDPVNFRDWLGLDEESLVTGQGDLGNSEHSIPYVRYGTGTENVWIITAGHHGNETEGQNVAADLIEHFEDNPVPDDTSVYIAPVINPTGERNFEGSQANRTVGLENPLLPDAAVQKLNEIARSETGASEESVNSINIHSFTSDQTFEMNIAPGYTNGNDLEFNNGKSDSVQTPSLSSNDLSESIQSSIMQATGKSKDQVRVGPWLQNGVSTAYPNDYMQWSCVTYPDSPFVEVEFDANSENSEYRQSLKDAIIKEIKDK